MSSCNSSTKMLRGDASAHCSGGRGLYNRRLKADPGRGTVMEEASVIAFFQAGGTTMYFLLAASIIALTLIFERSWSLRRSVVIPLKQVQDVENAVKAGDVDGAMQVCRGSNTTMGRILWVALKNRGVSRNVMKEILEEIGRQEVAYLERYINLLGVVASVAPLLGLLGTVLGMVEVFDQISSVGMGNPSVLAGGIAKALNTTVAGLCIAIPSLVAYRLFDSRVNNFVVEIEHHALRFVEMLKGERQ
jgi:biopolymer transport protein ExbB